MIAPFGSRTGTSPLTLLRDMRLRRARLLLERTDDTLDVVAQRCGMGEAAHWVACFALMSASRPANGDRTPEPRASIQNRQECLTALRNKPAVPASSGVENTHLAKQTFFGRTDLIEWAYRLEFSASVGRLYFADRVFTPWYNAISDISQQAFFNIRQSNKRKKHDTLASSIPPQSACRRRARANRRFANEVERAGTDRPGSNYAQKRCVARLKIGVASYTLRKMPLDVAIKDIQRVGLHYVSIKDAHLAMKSTPEERKTVAQKFKDAGITP